MPNTENYMDYADCSRMFTSGQVSRMHAAARSNLGSRSNMVSEANLIATGVNYPRFKAIAFIGNPKSAVCLSESITMLGGTFIDYAQADVTYNWQIEGATQMNITGPNPMVAFSTPGYKRVKLVVSNAIGSDSITIDSLFNVSGARVIGRAPYIQTFSNTNLLSPAVVGDSAWTFYSSGSQNFTVANLGIEGNTGKSLVLRPFNNGSGSNATLETPPILTRLDSINEFLSVHFYYAAARRTSSTATTSDIVTVSASNDCGRTWTNVATINTPEVLYTTNRLSPGSIFIPNNQGEWKLFTSARIPSALYRTNNLQFRINYNAIGTNTSTFYIDNFQVALRPVLSAKAKLTEAFDLNVVPNPSVGNSTIRFTAQASTLTTISVSDVAGRTVGSIEINPEIGINELPLSSIAKQLKAGVYTLRISNGSAIQVRKFVAAE
jgi:PKD repeat protein